jgi:hypothetical protein
LLVYCVYVAHNNSKKQMNAEELDVPLTGFEHNYRRVTPKKKCVTTE